MTLTHPKYTKPQKGNKTDRKEAKWICDLFMCDMNNPSFIPPPAIRHLRNLVRYRVKLTRKIKSTRISRTSSYLNPLLVQVVNSMIRSTKHPEFDQRYRCIKARRGHNKAIIAVCKILLTVI